MNPVCIAQIEWDVAVPKIYIDQYDEPKIAQMQSVEKFVKSTPMKTLKKKAFFTISTNILCADLNSSSKNVNVEERDLYLPLEISIAKWSVSKSKDENRELETRHWMINPGRPTQRSISIAKDHTLKHKIRFDTSQPDENNPYITQDLHFVVKEINGFIGPDRTVFALDIFRLRQDLGCLKWLNKQIGYKMKPIKVYSLRDLYVVLLRHLYPDNDCIGIGIATHRLKNCKNPWDTTIQCKYHQIIAKQDNDDNCEFCTLALVKNHSNQLLDDLELMSTDV